MAVPPVFVVTNELICSPFTGEPIKSQPLSPPSVAFTYLLYLIFPVDVPCTISDEYELEEELSVTVPLFEKLPDTVKSFPAFIVREPDDSTVRFVT